MFLCHALPIVDKIFFCRFGISCFVHIVLPFVDISLVFLLLLEPSGFISSSCMVIFSHVVFFILFPHILGSFCFNILACFRRFFIWVSSETSHPGLDYFFVLFEGTPIFSHTKYVAYSFSRYGSSFLICCFWLVPLDVFGIVSVFSSVFLLFQGQKTILFYYCSNLIGKFSACSLKTSTFLPDLYHSFPIISLWRVAPKIAVKCKMIVFLDPCFAF